MKLVKVLICVALSLSFLIIGIGFAVPNATLNFTGDVSFQHTNLYISNVTTQGNVNIIGYSGTMFTLTADKGATMTVSITNPLIDPYYYLNYTAGDHTLTTTAKLGDEVPAGGTLKFTVTFDDVIDHEHMVKFNFTAVPPTLEEPDPPVDPDNPGGGGNNENQTPSNATAAVEFVINNVSRGLNSGNDKHTFEQWCNEGNRILYCLDNTVSGGNLNKEFANIGAAGVYFTMEWVSSTKYNAYLYSATDATNNLGKYIVVYKQEIIFNSVDTLWVNGDSFKGYAKVVNATNGNGIEIGEDENGKNCVVWYNSLDSLPEDAVLVTQTTKTQ